LAVPDHVAGIPDEVLRTRNTWTDPAAYDAQAHKLADMFRKNFEKFGEVDPAIRDAGPKGGGGGGGGRGGGTT
jgi:phosphoenolpyruvate carboxykinase (ATP)